MPSWRKNTRKTVPRGYLSHLRAGNMSNLPIIQSARGCPVDMGRLQESLRKLNEVNKSGDADYERETPGDGCVKE